MYNGIKKIGVMCCIAALLLSFSGFQSVTAATNKSVKVYSDVPVKTVSVDKSNANYPKELLATEIYNYKLIRNIPTAYQKESWDKYCSVANILLNIDSNKIGEIQLTLIGRAVTARKELVQVKSIKDSIWYLWNKSMPMVESADSLKFTEKSYDNSDFKPFLVPYLYKDQSKVKGNLIIIAGGGYSSRGNAGEGYPIAEAFLKKGYNCYVLQRRVDPYSMKDIWMDMQRSIRLVRYEITEKQLGGEKCLIAVGFSGGSATILGSVANLYGSIQPTIYDSSYIPDKIDSLNADLDVVLSMYGPNYTFSSDGSFKGLETVNPHIPAFFITAGADDKLIPLTDSVALAESVKGKASMVEFHTFANVGHGFGAGVTGTNSKYWITMADNFVKQFISGGKLDTVELKFVVPTEYTKSQTYNVKFPFGAVDVTYASNATGDKFYIYFTAFDSKQILEGYVGKDGIITVTYDESGFMAGDAQKLVDSADKNAWKEIKR